MAFLGAPDPQQTANKIFRNRFLSRFRKGCHSKQHSQEHSSHSKGQTQYSETDSTQYNAKTTKSKLNQPKATKSNEKQLTRKSKIFQRNIPQRIAPHAACYSCKVATNQKQVAADADSRKRIGRHLGRKRQEQQQRSHSTASCSSSRKTRLESNEVCISWLVQCADEDYVSCLLKMYCVS
jgi:hypothetical protein